MMDYDVVVATRNRPEALRLSIPLILGQGRPPHQLIIVDASDDHEQTRQSVIRAVGDSPVKLEILYSRQPNIALQRNMGIDCVKSPVVMFTDDDVFWWQGVGEAIMRVYERDRNGHIGGVCGVLATDPPPEAQLFVGSVYKMRLTDCIRQRIEFRYNKFVYRFCPDPFWIHGRSRWNVQPVPDWLPKENAVLVEYMGGARMSFRTEAIRSRGFDEDLGAYLGYSKSEDTEASFYVMQKRLIVGVHDAKLYHHKFPGQRAESFDLGFISLFNPAYIVCRYSPNGSAAREAVKQFSIFKLMQYVLRMHTKFGRDRVRGAMLAIRLMKILLNTPPARLRERYLELCENALQGHESR